MFISLPFFCYETVSIFFFFSFFVHVSLTLLCESTANWQPVITTHLPCSAPALLPTFSSKHNRGTFLNWPLGNSIYLRSVAAEFALSSIGFGKIGVKTPDKITKVGILLEPGNKRRLWGEAAGPHREPWDRVSTQVRRSQECPLSLPARETGSHTQGTSKSRAHQANYFFFFYIDTYVYTP